MARITNQDGQNPISITRVNGTAVETAMFAWDVRGGVVTQLFPATEGTTDPRNTYSDWVNSGNPFNQTDSTTTSLGAFQLIPTARNIQFQNEAQLQTTLTITTASQNQTRTCTATGGCDGPFSRTIRFEASRGTSTRFVNTRATTTLNPRYVIPITDADLEGFVNCQIDRNTGVVTFSQAGNLVNAEGGRINLFIRLAPGQTRNYNIIPFDGNPSSETISLLVSGEVPRGFANEGSLFEDIIVECDTTQQPEIQPPPTLSVRILWRNAFGSQNTRVSGSGTTVSLPGAIGTYSLSTISDGTVTIDPISLDGSYFAQASENFTVTAVGGGGTTRLSFTVMRTTTTDPEPGDGGGPGEPIN